MIGGIINDEKIFRLAACVACEKFSVCQHSFSSLLVRSLNGREMINIEIVFVYSRIV
jgi:hypothetical protein